MHRLQQHILQQLIFHQARRYSQLKPAEVESNLFVYHLHQLIKAALVEKQDNGLYCLTPAGQAYADSLSLESLQPRLQPRIVTLIALQNSDGEYLLYRRKRQPMLGLVGFPYGKVHVGETIMQAANRELFEKTGLEADLAHRGDGYITVGQDRQTVSQIMFHLFTGQPTGGQLTADTQVGQVFWGNPRQIAGWELMPSLPDLLEAIDSGQHFFLERSYQLAGLS